MTVTVQEVRSSLRLLGRTANAVAETLEHKGIRGTLEQSDKCPIAVYLQQQFPELDEVWADDVVTYQDGTEEGGMFRAPWAVERFIHRFDEGHYPALVADD